MEREVKELKDLVRNVVDGTETVFDVIQEVGDGGETGTRVSVGYKALLPEPLRPVKADAQARNHKFHSLDQFSEYLEREACAETSIVLADFDRRYIVAVLDESDERDRELVSFEAKTHPLFKPWEALIGKAIPVLEFALHVMQYRNGVEQPDGRELALMFSQIKASKRVVKHVGIGPKSLNGVVVEMKIGSEVKETEVELPESVTIDVPLFLSTDPQQLQLDLLVTERGDGELVVFVTAPELEEVRVKAFEQMVRSVREQTGMCVGLGVIDHRPFRTLDFYEQD